MLVKKSRRQIFLNWFLKNPRRMIVMSFLFVILTGTFLLSLPISTRPGIPFTVFDALFTATSATCVTGLIVSDTATTFTTFGKFVIITLIQIGGLGPLTITSFVLSFTKKKVSLKTRRLASESSGSFSYSELPVLLRFIIIITLAFEFIGGLILSLDYVPRFGPVNGISKAFFQAVSSFCNAGFDIIGDTEYGRFCSLTPFYDDPLVLITTAVLIIFGGLGFVVWIDLFSFNETHRLRTHTKIMLKMTALLLISGTVLYLIFDWDNTLPGGLGNYSSGQKVLAAFFQSASMRTAGFNSIDLKSMTDGSKFISVVLMFIGAGSGSTAGGIKVTTFAILIYAVVSEFRGSDDLIAEKSHISGALVRRSLTILVSGIAVVSILSLILSVTERAAIVTGRISFIDLLFEAASAFGTVGVTSANTSHLTSIGQLFIIPVMFIGRVGPITMALSFAIRDNKLVNTVYPEGKVHIG